MFFDFHYKIILKNYYNNFNKNIINYFSGKYSENEFKILRLQYGFYRQRFSYMYRISIIGGILNYFQLLVFSYLSFFYDNSYFHFTTRTNIQFNWVKIFYVFEILKKLSFVFISSIQTSGNCVRNINNSFKNDFKDLLPWSEIIRQWFSFNSEYLFFPRKFKIFILNCKYSQFDKKSFKIHDLGLYFNKNNTNKLFFNLLVGGGLGRTPIIGFYIFKNIFWKRVINYVDKIIRIYNLYGFRNNIYKSRIKILFKSLNYNVILNFIKKEFNFSNNYIYFLNEKNINLFFENINILKNYNIKKNIVYNYFFLNWFNNSNNYNFFCLSLKSNNTSPGDINYNQSKILYFFFKFFNLKSSNRQNIILYFNNNFELFHLKLKRYFFNIYNFNLITDIVSCPGKDYCVLANTKSIIIFNIINNIFKDFNTLFKLNNISLNVSGCVNSCSHHHISTFGFLGVNKNNKNFYQIYTNFNYNYDYLSLSKVFSSSIIYFKISSFFILILKKYFIF